MSFEPVTYYHLRCDGPTTRGQCPQLLWIHEYDDDYALTKAVTATPEIDSWRSTLEHYGWMVGPDGKLHCPHHVAAAEQTAKAALEGLPFDDIVFVPADQAFPEEPH